MMQEKLIHCSELIPAINEILQNGCRVRLTVTGNSMFPFLRFGADSVDLISPSGYKLRRGDIVLIAKNPNQYVLHRIVSIRGNDFYLAGDAQNKTEGPFCHSQVIALVFGILRKNHYIPSSNFIWRLLSLGWIVLYPIRKPLLYCIRHIRFIPRRWFSS